MEQLKRPCALVETVIVPREACKAVNIEKRLKGMRGRFGALLKDNVQTADDLSST